MSEAAPAYYQILNDSPTIKHYTSWEFFDKLFQRDPLGEVKPKRLLFRSPAKELLITPSGYKFDRRDPLLREEPFDLSNLKLFSPSEGLLYWKHFKRLRSQLTISLPRGSKGLLRILLLPPESGSYSGHIKLIAEANADWRLELIYSPSAPSGSPFLTMELEQMEGSRLSVLLSSLAGKDNALFFVSRGLVIDGGSMSFDALIKGGNSFVRKDAVLQGSSSKASVRAAQIVGPGEKSDLMVNVMNSSVGGEAEVVMRGFNFGGEIVQRGNLKATAESSGSSNTLVSSILKMNSVGTNITLPMLEIETDEIVKAEHSSDISSLNEDLLYYMATRGFSRDEAVELIVKSYLASMLEGHMGEDELLEFLEELI